MFFLQRYFTRYFSTTILFLYAFLAIANHPLIPEDKDPIDQWGKDFLNQRQEKQRMKIIAYSLARSASSNRSSRLDLSSPVEPININSDDEPYSSTSQDQSSSSTREDKSSPTSSRSARSSYTYPITPPRGYDDDDEAEQVRRRYRIIQEQQARARFLEQKAAQEAFARKEQQRKHNEQLRAAEQARNFEKNKINNDTTVDIGFMGWLLPKKFTVPQLAQIDFLQFMRYQAKKEREKDQTPKSKSSQKSPVDCKAMQEIIQLAECIGSHALDCRYDTKNNAAIIATYFISLCSDIIWHDDACYGKCYRKFCYCYYQSC